MISKTTVQNFKYEIVDSSIAYFKFYEGASAEEFQAGLDELMKVVALPEIQYLFVANESKRPWEKEAEAVWRNTGILITKHNIKKWGVVTPDSAIRKMTLNRIISLGGVANRSYDIKLSESEEEVMNWLKE